MQNRFRFALQISLLILLLVACGGGDDDSDDADSNTAADIQADIMTRDAWLRPAVLPEGAPTTDPERDHDDAASSGVITALYMVIENNGSTAVQLTGVETDVARVVEMHQTQNQTGLMQMRPVASIEIPAGDEVLFEPGSFHIMLIDVNRQLETGDDVAVTLVFDNGERLELPAVPVQEL